MGIPAHVSYIGFLQFCLCSFYVISPELVVWTTHVLIPNLIPISMPSPFNSAPVFPIAFLTSIFTWNFDGVLDSAYGKEDSWFLLANLVHYFNEVHYNSPYCAIQMPRFLPLFFFPFHLASSQPSGSYSKTYRIHPGTVHLFSLWPSGTGLYSLLQGLW